jgi:hypothetical protein
MVERPAREPRAPFPETPVSQHIRSANKVEEGTLQQVLRTQRSANPIGSPASQGAKQGLAFIM